MNEDLNLNELHYSQIKHYNYPKWFEEIRYNGRILSPAERREFVSIIDETVDGYVPGLKMMYEELEAIKDIHDEFHELLRAVVSCTLFVFTTMTDILVLSKYFMLANKDYERRILRGKLKIVLNEGFKRLYGFNEKDRVEKEWGRLAPLMKHFPTVIRQQYKTMTILLNNQATTSSWWKEDRDLETHLEATKLYVSRNEDVIESKVMIDAMKLYNALLATSDFLTNAHACLLNTAIDICQRKGVI